MTIKVVHKVDEELPDEVACQVENLQLSQGLQPRDAPDPNSKIIFKGTAPWRIEHYPSMALYAHYQVRHTQNGFRSIYWDAHTKRPKTKKILRQNVPRDQTYQGTKRPKGQNIPRDKTS